MRTRIEEIECVVRARKAHRATGVAAGLRVDRAVTQKPLPHRLRERLLNVAKPQKVMVAYFTMASTELPVEFVNSLIELRKPRIHTIVHQPARTQADGRESLCRGAVEDGYTHVFMMDVDMLYPRNMLLDLLAADVDVVCGFALSRHTPHFPTFGPRGARFGYMPSWPTEDGHRNGKLNVGLRRTAIVGGAGALIRVDALCRMPNPWFFFPGEGERGLAIGEDVWFTQLCEDHKVETWCATNIHVAHQVKCWILPKWTPASVVDEDGKVVGYEPVENERLGRWDMNVDGLSNLYEGPTVVDASAAFDDEVDPVQVRRPPVSIGDAL